MPIKDRLEHFIERRADSCWLWTGARNKQGYGCIRVNGRQQGAHRASYEAFVGAIPNGLTLDHLCGNPACVNPAHLEPVTNRENVRRGNAKHNGATQFQPGERHWNAKMTRDQVLEARARYAQGGTTEKKLAAEYGIGKSAMHDLLCGINWKAA